MYANVIPLVIGPTVEFYGWEVIGYYINNISNYLAEYSWQVRTAYGLIVTCIFIMILLFFMFIILIRRRTKYKKKYDKLSERFHDPFYQILILPEAPSSGELEEILGCNEAELRKYNPKMFAQMILSLRMEQSEILYLPNVQFLADISGATDYFEKSLVTRKNIFETLQMIVNMNIIISEGKLAIYLNHHTTNIKLMARLAYSISTENEPYKYLEEDLKEKLSLWRPMLTHRLFGYSQSCGRPMPSFLTLASELKNEDSAAFLIEEVAYWGSEEEKRHLPDFFLSKWHKCRIAALHATAQLGTVENEDEMVNTYDRQPENIKREILKTLLSIGSGKRVDFFEKVYNTTSSKETREQALTCLYFYGPEGRRRFEIIRSESQNDEGHKILMDQIDSANLLKQLQELSKSLN